MSSVSCKIIDAGRVPPHSPLSSAILSCKVKEILIPLLLKEIFGVIIK